ncbi:tetratricopeptide repeat protein [Rubrivivax albus]|nr:tetratricopeptide repeat protein [Rubrivivax albus]
MARASLPDDPGPPLPASARSRLAATLIDQVLQAQRQGTLADLLRQRPRATRRLLRRFVPLVQGSGDGNPWPLPELVDLLLQWAVGQLRPDLQPLQAPVSADHWLGQAGWRPVLALAGHQGLLRIPDFPARYRRRTDEPALDNLCGLWDVAPSSVYRYLDRARQQLVVLLCSGPPDVAAELALRALAAQTAQAAAHDAQAAHAAPAHDWHRAQMARALAQGDAPSALWHAWRAGDAHLAAQALRRHAAGLAADRATDAIVERIAADPSVGARERVEFTLARAELARTRGAAETELRHLEAALQAAHRTGDRRLTGIAYGALGRYHEPRDADRAFACYQDSAEFLHDQPLTDTLADDGADAAAELATTLARLAWLYLLRNDPRAGPTLDRITALGERFALPDAVLGLVEQVRGEHARRRGELAQAIEHRQRALNIFERLGDRRSMRATLLNLSQDYAEAGDTARAIETATQVLEAPGVTEPEIVVSAHLNIGAAHFLAGALGASLGAYGQALALAGNAGLRLHAFRARYNLAEAHYTRFRRDADPEDERLGDQHRDAALATPVSDCGPAALEAVRRLRRDVLGDGNVPEADRLLPAETAVHVEAFAEIRRLRERLAAGLAPEAHARVQLDLARCYAGIALTERELARAWIARHDLGPALEAELEALRRQLGRAEDAGRSLADQWAAEAGDLLDAPRQQAVVQALLVRGELAKSAYAEIAGVAPATASRHLALLAQRGLLVVTGRGPATRYRPPPHADAGLPRP